jgi:HPt (histidine-containing phosphotransfer) domain-containing protein
LPIILLAGLPMTVPRQRYGTQKVGHGKPESGDNGGKLPNHGQDWAGLKSAGFDPEALWGRVEGDAELLRDLITVFEEESPSMLAKLAAAIQNGDAADLERAAHKIKGSALQFSGLSAAAAALDLEQMGRRGALAGAEAALERLRQEIDVLLKSLHAMAGEMSQ